MVPNISQNFSLLTTDVRLKKYPTLYPQHSFLVKEKSKIRLLEAPLPGALMLWSRLAHGHVHLKRHLDGETKFSRARYCPYIAKHCPA